MALPSPTFRVEKFFMKTLYSAGTVEAAVEMLKSTDYILEGFIGRRSSRSKRLVCEYAGKGQAKVFVMYAISWKPEILLKTLTDFC